MSDNTTLMRGAGLILMLALAGCVDGLGKKASEPVAANQPGQSVTELDVEAPDVFQMTGPGLWDGRPSLGGVWVAHSSVKDPERVLIRNPANGKSVVGALFRREREQPGPSIQVSSDAAEELGLLAGAPSDLSIVVLRRTEVPAAAEDADTVAPAEPQMAEAEGETATEGAEAATDDSAARDAAAAGAVAAAAAATEAGAEAPKKKGFLSRLFGGKKKTAEAAAPVTGGIATGTIEQAPLDPLVAGAAASIAAAEAAQAQPAAAPAAAPAPAPAGDVKRAYIQIGIFSNQDNAARAAKQMQSAGLSTSVVPETIKSKPYWRVLVGPAASVASRDALVAKVRGIGYPDAYPVSR